MSTRTAFTVVGAVVGAVVGFYTGNVALGFQIGTAIGGLVGNEVDPVKLYGPRLGDAKFQSCRDGVPIPWGIGRFRVTGTIIACQPGPPTETEAESREGKGSGPVNVNYNYTRTHAILICEGEILGVRRIWRDNKLVYDTSEQPTTANTGLTGSELASLLQQWAQLRAQATSFASKIRLYNGSETQLPDSALEAIFGAGNVSAHRGTAYMVVVDDDVTARGGSIPQYDFEVVVAGTNEPYTDGSISSLCRWDTDYTDLTGKVWTPLLSDISVDSTFGRFGGALHGTGGYAALLTPWSDDFNFVDDDVDWTMGVWYYGTDVLNSGWGTGLFCWRPDTNSPATWYISGAGIVTFEFGIYLLQSTTVITAGQWYYLEIGREAGVAYLSVNAVIEDTGPMLGMTYPVGVDAQIGATYYSSGQSNLDGWLDDFFCIKGVALRTQVLPTAPAFSQVLPDAPDFSVDNNGNIFYVGGSGAPDSLIPTTPTVQQALELIAARTGATPDMYDFSALAGEEIEGFFVAREAQGDAVTNAIGQGYFFDCAEWDGKIRAVPRGENSVLTIDVDDLAKREGAPVSEMREQEIERPRKLNVIYSDPAMNYIPTKQTAERTTATISAIGERTIELAIVMDKNQAAQIADKAIKVTWTDLLGTVTFDLPDAFSYLTPTDVIILSYRGKNQRLRIDAIAYDVGRMSVSCRQDRQSCYTSDVEGVGTPPALPPSGLLGFTRVEFINAYPLRDQDDRIGFYVACKGVLPDWPGASIEASIDDGASWKYLASVSNPAIIGNTVNAVLDHPSHLIDYGSTLRVNVGSATLSSITFEQLLQEQNGAIVGDEVINFQTATLVSPGVYDLSVIARGRIGTATTAHAIGERFVMLAGAFFVEADSSLFGKEIQIRASTNGTTSANNQSYEADYTVPLIQTELAPSSLLSYRASDDAVSLYWSGRGRLGTNANAFHGTKFGGYRLTFTDGVTSVVKTNLGASYIYSAADQTTDFGATVPFGDLTVDIQQLNTITGAGPALTEIV